MFLDLPYPVEVILVLAEIVVLARVLSRPHREPASRLAWLAVVISVPLFGIIAYLILGETRISGGRRDHGRNIDAQLPRPKGDPACLVALGNGAHQSAFALASKVNCLDPTCGNAAQLLDDSNAAIDAMVDDIDAAKAGVHLCTYIWLDDENGVKIKDACIAAARRGVDVRILADALGSRRFIRSRHWRELHDSGCKLRVALRVGNPLWTVIRGRVDLRNHRKMMIVDNRLAWIGSQNLADPQFRIKRRFAPWVDIMTRWEGQVARHVQFLFVSDWAAEGGDDISGLLQSDEISAKGTILTQVIGTGPTASFDAMPSCFSELIHAARNELVITTPYFVPDEQLLFALTSAARRGVDTIMILPQRCDSWTVAATSRSYYEDLIKAGVKLFEYRGGMLHSKSIIVDRTVGLIGSANLDRRSFELNFEDNILFADADFAAKVRDRQEQYLSSSNAVTADAVERVGLLRRIWQNLLATMSPVL